MQDESKSISSAEGQVTLELTGGDALYLRWAQDLSFNVEIQAPNVDTENDNEYVPTVRA